MFNAFVQISVLLLSLSLFVFVRRHRRVVRLLRRDARLAESIVEASPDAIFVLNGDLRILRASAATHQLFGLTSEVGNGKDFARLFSPAERDAGGHALRQTLHLTAGSVGARCYAVGHCADGGALEAECGPDGSSTTADRALWRLFGTWRRRTASKRSSIVTSPSLR